MICYFIGGPWDLTKRDMWPVPYYDVAVLPPFQVIHDDGPVLPDNFARVRYEGRRLTPYVFVYMPRWD